MLHPVVESLVTRGLVKAGYSMFMADCAGPNRLPNGTVALPEAQWPGGIAAWSESQFWMCDDLESILSPTSFVLLC